MSRLPVAIETKQRDAVLSEIKKETRAAYIPPSNLSLILKKQGLQIPRQYIIRRYREAGINYDKTLGLWMKKGES